MKDYTFGSMAEAHEQVHNALMDPANSWRYATFHRQGEKLLAMMEKALNLEATEAEMLEAVREFDLQWWLRPIYTSTVSWALYSKEYVESLQRLLQAVTGREHPKVLEVAAGKGLLGSLPNWACTDEWSQASHVLEMDALAAVEAHKDADVLFASWLPYTDPVDFALASKWVGEMHKPMIIVGEGTGGCTGSERFWGIRDDTGDRAPTNYQVVRAYDIEEGFTDVPHWIFIGDSTYACLPL